MSCLLFPELHGETLFGWDGSIEIPLRARVITHVSDMETPRIQDVISAVSGVTGFLPNEIRGPDKHKKISNTRQMVMYLSYQHTRKSFSDIARELGGRDHSTIIHGVQAHLDRVDDIPALKKCQDKVEKILGVNARKAGSYR